MMDNATLNIFMHIIFFFWIISLGKIPRSGITRSKGMNILWLLICASRIKSWCSHWFWKTWNGFQHLIRTNNPFDIELCWQVLQNAYLIMFSNFIFIYEVIDRYYVKLTFLLMVSGKFSVVITFLPYALNKYPLLFICRTWLETRGFVVMEVSSDFSLKNNRGKCNCFAACLLYICFFHRHREKCVGKPPKCFLVFFIIYHLSLIKI